MVSAMNIHNRSLFTAIAIGAIAIAGCGSSSHGTGTQGTGAKTNGTTTEKSGGSLKVATTPKFAAPEKSEPVQSGTVHVAYRYITIQPDTLRVKVGTTVVWTNYDSVKDNVKSISGPQRIASKDFGEGESFSVELTKPGIIHYESTPYPTTMNGSIEVVG
jgi:plastocyanin